MHRAKAISRVLPIALFLLTIAAFWPARNNGFIKLDDQAYVTDNPRVKQGLTWGNLIWASKAIVSANWHPATLLSHMVDVQLFGLRPGWHHLMSILLHGVAVLILLQFLRESTDAPWRSAFVAALFAVHPLRVESVAWVAERKDVLSGLFFMLLLWTYGRYTRQPASSAAARKFYVASLLSLLLGLMSKPMLVTAPFVLLLADAWPLKRLPQTTQFEWARIRPLLWEKLPAFALVGVVCAITFLVQDKNQAVAGGLPLSIRFSNAISSYWKYLGLTIWPTNLAIYYPHPGSAYFAPPGLPTPTTPGQWPTIILVVAGMVLLAVCILAWLSRIRFPWLTTGWFWYLGMLVPVIGIVQVGGQGMADRYSYLPLIGIFICVAWAMGLGAERWPTATWALAGCGALAILACALLTRRQVTFWRDNFTVFQHALDVNPNNAVAQYQVGVEWGERQELDKALAHLDAAKLADPTFAETYRSRGIALELMGRPAEALADYKQIAAIKPWLDWPFTQSAAQLWKQGLRDEAINQYRLALRNNPANAETLALFGAALVETGSATEAVPLLNEALRIDPNQLEAMRALALASFLQGRFAEAETQYRIYTRLNPTNADARVNLGGVLWRLGKQPEAKEEFRTAVRLSPTNALAHFNLGNALVAQGQLAEAVAEFDQASRLKTGYVEALGESGKALLGLKRYDDARTRFATALELAPANASLQMQMGVAWRLEGQSEQAKACFEKALSLDPQLPSKLVEAGKSFAARGQTAAAIERLQTAAWLQPENQQAKNELERLRAQPSPP